jgi:hypothetical protein
MWYSEDHSGQVKREDDVVCEINIPCHSSHRSAEFSGARCKPSNVDKHKQCETSGGSSAHPRFVRTLEVLYAIRCADFGGLYVILSVEVL